ncbi:Phosphatidylinositol-4-phosphate_5-kinase [Hexamita inflata]|uniref:Putative n=1 Tax=Hexamita inflata TaxID=28002 RepID=A0AA86R6S0_9EUKA|nr:Phosphatidylinositol-4-phosphate 5-kinase [Hexamita inflata]
MRLSQSVPQSNASTVKQSIQSVTKTQVFKNPCEEEFGKEWAFFSPDGSAYKGTWLKALRHGYGVHVYPNGDVYKGEFKANLPHGQGCFYSRNPKQTSESKKQILQFPENEAALTLIYEGQWEKGYRQGFGRFYYSPVSFYCGYWHSNMKHGYGILFYSPETERSSVLTAAQQQQQTHVVVSHGVSTIKSSRYEFGPIFIGQFQEDSRAGEGRVIYPNGDVFVGIFDANAAQGQGVLYFVEKHSRQLSNYALGQSVCSQIFTDYSYIDYETILQAWAHICGGFPALSYDVYQSLHEKFPCDWEAKFQPDEHAYPYSFRAENNPKAAQIIIETDSVEVMCRNLPVKMRPDQNEAAKMLHLPVEDDGKTVPVNMLVDPVGVLAEQIAK